MNALVRSDCFSDGAPANFVVLAHHGQLLAVLLPDLLVQLHCTMLYIYRYPCATPGEAPGSRTRVFIYRSISAPLPETKIWWFLGVSSPGSGN